MEDTTKLLEEKLVKDCTDEELEEVLAERDPEEDTIQLDEKPVTDCTGKELEQVLAQRRLGVARDELLSLLTFYTKCSKKLRHKVMDLLVDHPSLISTKIEREFGDFAYRPILSYFLEQDCSLRTIKFLVSLGNVNGSTRNLENYLKVYGDTNLIFDACMMGTSEVTISFLMQHLPPELLRVCDYSYDYHDDDRRDPFKRYGPCTPFVALISTEAPSPRLFWLLDEMLEVNPKMLYRYEDCEDCGWWRAHDCSVEVEEILLRPPTVTQLCFCRKLHTTVRNNLTLGSRLATKQTSKHSSCCFLR